MKKTLYFIMAAIAALSYAGNPNPDGDPLPAAETGKVDAGTPGAIQFAPDRAGRGNAEPGRLQAIQIKDTSGNDMACLTVGTPDGQRVPVVDRYALHRVPYKDVDFPDYYIDFASEEGMEIKGDGHEIHAFTNTVINGAGINPDTQTYTRTFWLRPCNGGALTSVTMDKVISVTPTPLGGGSNLIDLKWDVIDDSIFVQVQLKQYMDTYYYTYAGCVIKRVTKVDATLDDVRDDLTSGDYYFTDRVGNTSLGGIRSWVKSCYDNYKADLWANYPAINQVKLNGNSIKFNAQYFAKVEDRDGTGDQFTIYAKAKPAIRIVAGAGGTNDTFRIIGVDFSSSDDYDYVYTDTSEQHPYVISCDDLLTTEWYIPDGQSTSAEPTTYKGESAWCIAVPKDPTKKTRFYRAVSQDGAVTSAYVYTEFIVYAKHSVAIPDSNGDWWQLKVSTSGAISAEKVAAPTCEVE